MKHRNLLVTVLLAYFTFGIYMLFWLYDTRKGLVEKLGDNKAVPSILYIFAPYIALVLMFFLSLALRGQTFANILVIFVGMFAVLAIPVILIYWFYKYTSALHQVTQGQDPILHLVLALVIGPIWLILAQHDINKYLESGAGAAPSPAATSAPAQPAPTPEQQPPTTEQPPAPGPNEDTTPKV